MSEGDRYRLQVTLSESLDLPESVVESVRNVTVTLTVDERAGRVHCLLPPDLNGLDEDLRKDLEEQFRTLFPAADEVSVVVPPEEGVEALVAWLREHWNHVKRSLSQRSTGSRSLLEYARPREGEESVRLELPKQELLRMAESRDLADDLRTWVHEELGQGLPVSLALGDFTETLEDDARRFEEEEREELARRRQRQQVRAEQREDDRVLGDEIKSSPVSLEDLSEHVGGTVTVEGKVIDCEFRETSEGKKNLVSGILSDRRNSLRFKHFTEENSSPLAGLEGEWVRMRGRLQEERFRQSGGMNLIPNDVNTIPPKFRRDEAPRKRVEFHCHTNMSQMDGLASVEDLVERAAAWDHPALAITDHGVVHSFPEAAHAARECGVKIIFGVEGYLVPEERPLVMNGTGARDPETSLLDRCVVLDCETTGLSPQLHEPFQISALRIREGEVVDRISRLLRVEEIDERILSGSSFEREELMEAPEPEAVMEELGEFIGEDPVVCYEAYFTRNTLNNAGLSFRGPVVHLRQLAERTWEPPESALNELAERRFQHTREHRFDADLDAENTLRVLEQLSEDREQPLSVEGFREMAEETDVTAASTHHIILLARNHQGLRNLYRLISESHVNDFYRRPRMKRGLIEEHREGLLVGSACESGEVFQKVLEGAPREEVVETMKFYDVIEVQPVENNRFMLEADGPFEDIHSLEDIQELTRTIYELGRELGKPVVGTGDVHFLDPEDEMFRRVLQDAQDFSDPDDQPPLYLRTTDEMLDSFSFLGDEDARRVAVENPRRVADLCEPMEPIPDEFCPPTVEGAREEFDQKLRTKLKELYGESPPDFVTERLEVERQAIIENRFSNLYVIASWMVEQSKQDGYLVGSRGSVGSSLAAYLVGITEINPLPAHYRCPDCYYVEQPGGEADVGVDLEPADCPECGTRLVRDGYKIPFEVFLGFEGDKVPDIDLNFSGEYQPEMFRFVRDRFGEENVFRAGTISTIAERTAGQFVSDYFEQRNLSRSRAEKERLMKGIQGVKRTTGQHPGGMIIVPEDRSIYEFTPINLPANDREAEFQTTHFDYHAMEEQLVKLDILGHDDPTQLRHLEELTGVDPETVPLDDEETLSLFSGLDVLDLDPEELGLKTGVLGIPEFNTNFVRQMVEETRPENFADLLRISGLSHGEGVWRGNADVRIDRGKASLDSVITCRDDIMNQLIDAGMPERKAFRIMEDVRKGRELDRDQVRSMKAHDLPEWYVESCQKIGYLFPKAHAAAYVVMAFRIAYFKVHHPAAFYASYCTLKASDINARYVRSQDQVEERMRHLQQQIREGESTNRDQTEYSVLEVIREAYLRDFKVSPPELSSSHPRRFEVEDDRTLRASYRTIEGMGSTVARDLYEEHRKQSFLSIEDAENRTGLNKALREEAEPIGFFEDLPKTDTVDLFEG